MRIEQVQRKFASILTHLCFVDQSALTRHNILNHNNLPAHVKDAIAWILSFLIKEKRTGDNWLARAALQLSKTDDIVFLCG